MKNDKIIIWGTGAEAQKFIKIVGTEQIAYFADNNERLWGSYFFERQVISMKDLLKLSKEYLVVIATVKYEQEIKEQLWANGFHNFINAKQYRVNKIFEDGKRNKQRIILMNTHDCVNIGDHLITVAELYFFRRYMPDYEIVEVPLTLCSEELDYIYRFVRKEDLLIITGGGFLGSLWVEGGEENVRKIVQLFTDNRIVVFPQTMFFEKNIEGEKQKDISKKIYNIHKNLTFCFRDKLSYQLGMDLFKAHIQKKYIPDIAALVDRSDEIFQRKGILMCMRDDKERTLHKSVTEQIERKLLERNRAITRISMLTDYAVTSVDRMDAVNNILHQIQTSELVITDRLHCMLLCAVSGTPCMAFDNMSGKVYGVYDWIKENIYIRLIDEGANIEDTIEYLLRLPPMVYKKNNIEKEFEKLALFLKQGE